MEARLDRGVDLVFVDFALNNMMQLESGPDYEDVSGLMPHAALAALQSSHIQRHMLALADHWSMDARSAP